MNSPFAMDISFFFFLLSTLSVAGLIGFILLHRKNLPPGPSLISSNLLLLTTSLPELVSIITNLKSKYGPFITLSIGFRPSIFVAAHSLAHQILIQKGAIFSDRHQDFAELNISSAAYGPTWRLLRRNLATEVFHPSRIKSYSWARKWVLQILIARLQEQKPTSEAGIMVFDHFKYTMFYLLVLMCFGVKLDDRSIKEIERVQCRSLLVLSASRFMVFAMLPRLGKILFRNRWKELRQIRKDQEDVLIPLIKSRIETENSETGEEQIVAYVDTLINLHLPEVETTNGNGGKLTDKEMVSMCGEFLNAGTDTTSTSIQWIMANLVKYPHIQNKLYDEIVTVVGPPPPPPSPGVEPESVINEDDLQKMSYLKAVVLEGLRIHPPGHFVLPHRVAKEVEVEGYKIPEGASINFLVAEMGRDPKVWEDPMEFKPERFLINDNDTINGVFDISGSKGIKMMPFGAGRRMCPGSDLALLHLEYFVANLIWFFKWTVVDGYEVDLSETAEFTTVMKNPLQTRIFPRTEI